MTKDQAIAAGKFFEDVEDDSIYFDKERKPYDTRGVNENKINELNRQILINLKDHPELGLKMQIELAKQFITAKRIRIDKYYIY